VKLKLSGQKVLIFNKEITTRSTRDLINQILYLDQTDGDVYLVINSTGGHTQSALLFYRTLKTSLKNKLITVLAGETASAATIFFLTGSLRYVYPDGAFYVHSGHWNSEMGFPMAELHTLVKSLKIENSAYSRIYADNSTISKKKWAKIIRKSKVFTSKQMLKYKLATELIEA